MRRFGVVLSVATLVLSLAAGVTNAAAATTGCGIRITALRFRPASVGPGGSSVVHLTTRNCTPQSQTVTLTWLGHFVGSTSGVPAGCPIIDPMQQSLIFAPQGRVATSLGFAVLPSCAATSLSETARITDGGGNLLAQRTANLLIS